MGRKRETATEYVASIDVHDPSADVGSVIRSARTSAGLSQQALAELIGTTQSAVSRWEKGHDEPRFATLGAIMSACGYRVTLTAEPDGVDRAQIRQQLAMTPAERLASVVNLSRTLATARREP